MTACVLFIAAHDEEARIGACLDAALASPLPADFVWRMWVVVDDASTDDSAAHATAWAQRPGRPTVEIVRQTRRAGKGPALQSLHRRMVDEGRGDEVVIVIDADVLVEPGAMAALVEPLAESSVVTVWGLGVPDRRSWGRRASRFQMLLTGELARAMGPTAGRAEGRLFAYRVGPLAGMMWQPDLMHEDLQLAALLHDRALPVRSAWGARVRVTPARGYRDFYSQTYRSYAARRVNGPTRNDRGGTSAMRTMMPAVARTGIADPVGLASYLVARSVAAVIHRVRPLPFADAWVQARSTKGPDDDDEPIFEVPRLHARIIVGSILNFRNWPTVLVGVLANRAGRPDVDLRFVTRAGHQLTCPSGMVTRAPVLEVFARRMYHLDRMPASTAGRSFKVLDVGAHVGAFVIEVAERFPDAQIDAYEPSPGAFQYLRSNVDRNALGSRVRLHAAAVAATDGRATLYEDGVASSANSLLPVPGASTREVPVVSFQSAVAAAGGHLDLLKLDCEGAEYDIVLASSSESWRGVGAVVLEYHAVAGRSPEELLGRLGELGFTMQWHERRPHGMGMAALARTDMRVGSEGAPLEPAAEPDDRPG